MKTNLLPIVMAGLLLLSTEPLTAQLNLGFKAGVNLAKQKFDGEGFTISPDNRIGLQVGAMAEVGLGENLAVQPEVLFIQKGFKADFDDPFTGEKSEMSLMLNHVEVPLLVKYKFPTQGIGFYLAGGPAVGYAASGKSKFDGESSKLEDEDWEGYNRLEVGAHAGAGVLIPVGAGVVCIDLRYILGLSNLNDDETDDTKAFNRGIGLSVGFFIGQ